MCAYPFVVLCVSQLQVSWALQGRKRPDDYRRGGFAPRGGEGEEAGTAAAEDTGVADTEVADMEVGWPLWVQALLSEVRQAGI